MIIQEKFFKNFKGAMLSACSILGNNLNVKLKLFIDENEKPKLYLFAPYIFYVSEEIENFESLSTTISKNGGCIDDAIDHTTTHVIQNQIRKKKKNIIYVRPEWILDSFRHKKLLNPHIPRYTPESI